jgi:hypothetical protein
MRLSSTNLRGADRLAQIALALFEHVLRRMAIDASLAVSLVEREVETGFPLRAVLRVWSGQRSAGGEENRLAAGRRGVGRTVEGEGEYSAGPGRRVAGTTQMDARRIRG